MTSNLISARAKRSSLGSVGRASRKRARPAKQRARVPGWASYVFGAQSARESFLAHKTQNDSEWPAFKEACRKACVARSREKAAGCATPARARELRDGGLAAFCKRRRTGARRPRDSSSFAAEVRKRDPAVASLTPRSHKLAVMRARTTRERHASRCYTHHTTRITARELNVTLLHDWLELEIDRTPHITSALLAQLESSPDAVLAWSYWKRHDMGRLFSDPWASLASMNRDARAVLCHGTRIIDLDMSACHHRIALALSELYNVASLEPLRDYVADTTAWRQRIAREACVSERDAKLAGVIFLNTGGMSTWIAACEYAPQLTESLRAELKALQSCCTRIRDATLARERDALPAALHNANARTQWSYTLCDREDTALRAIWRAVSALGASVVMLVYDGLMLLPGRARKSTLERAATRAASDALGCTMPVLAKPMKLPKAAALLIEQRATIAKLRAENSKLRKQRRADHKTIKFLRNARS